MSNSDILLNTLLDEIRDHEIELDQSIVARAFTYSDEAHKGQKRKSGEPYLLHPVEVARILAQLLEHQTDSAILCAALLHDVVEDTGIGIDDIRREFGDDVARLVDGVTKLEGLPFDSLESEQAENFRKMILSMSRDLRVILIKLADRLHNMRTLEFLAEDRRKAIALETREIYAPLAHRLGIGKLKWELEDLSLKYLDHDAYRRIGKLVAEKRGERENTLQKIMDPVREAMAAEGVSAEIVGRPKHFDSIYRKMQNKSLGFDNIYDLFGVRLVTETKNDCYRALGVLHDIYKPVPERFKDYIATPKTNRYQSLHTTVIGPEGRLVEFQIRTREMHRIAEFGVAAHYSYKQGGAPDRELDEHLGGLLEGTLAAGADGDDPQEYLDLLKTSLYQDEVFVFTPKGDLRRFPQGATSLDFAFLIHTDVGLKTVGARVNGRLVPLRYELRNGDVVEVITQANAHPSEYWPSILRTSSARQKARKWLKEQRREDSIALGREMLIRELKRHRKSIPPDRELIDAAQAFGFETVDLLIAAIGQGDLSVMQAVTRIFPELQTEQRRKSPLARLRNIGRPSQAIQVQGVGNLMLRFAQCCQPVPGDRIVGVVTRGRGMTVHRQDCPNGFEDRVDPERRVDLSWDVPEDQAFLVKLVITGDDRSGMLADLASAITGTGTNIKDAGMKGAEGGAEGTFIIEVKNLNHLNRVLSIIRKVRGVIRVERATLPGDES